MATKKPRKKSKKVLKQGPKQGPTPPPKPLTMRQKFMNWLTGDVSG